MTKKNIPSYLKLAAETTKQSATTQLSPGGNRDAALTRAGDAFAQATGWRLEYRPGPAKQHGSSPEWSAPVNPGVGASPGHLRLTAAGEVGERPAPLSLGAVAPLADAFAQLYCELLFTRQALRDREAELAAGVPVTLRRDDPSRLAASLEAVLRGGVEAVQGTRAALYLLDAGTTELKLRSSWNLDPRELMAPARPLRGSLADLEALLGHAVVMSEPSLFEYWKVPQACAAAVCVPVSSPTIPLGTLWIFSDTPRDFSDAQTGVLEVVAGRIAADLERHALAEEAWENRAERKQIKIAGSGWQQQMPRLAPLCDGWDVGARSLQAGAIGGAFHDWFALGGDALAIVAGCAIEPGASGAMTASALRAAARAASPRRSPEALIEKVNGILWSGSSGGDRASLFQAVLHAGAGQARFACAGPLVALVIERGRFQALVAPGEALGTLETLPQRDWVSNHQHKLHGGSALLIYSAAALLAMPSGDRFNLHERLSSAMQSELMAPADALAEQATGVLRQFLLAGKLSISDAVASDQVVVVIKRRS